MLLYLNMSSHNVNILDTSDFVVRNYNIKHIFELIYDGLVIDGIEPYMDSIAIREEKRYLIYRDKKYVFLRVVSYNHTFIEIFALNKRFPSYVFKYDNPKFRPSVVHLTDNIYEVRFFDNKKGYSVCFKDLGEGVISPIYRDKTLVPKGSKLTLTSNTDDNVCFSRIL